VQSEFEVVDDEIRFLAYPFAPASVAPAGVVRARDIRDADPGVAVAPPEVRLTSGETVFVAGGHDALRRFCGEHAVPLVRRPDVWSALLQPFVDTEFDGYWEARTHTELESYGITLDEIADIRARFAPVMVAYNAVLWDWVHLGLFDLLEALGGPVGGARPDELRDTYWWAMEIADRSRPLSEPLDDEERA
jgi:hypothetical protein